VDATDDASPEVARPYWAGALQGAMQRVGMTAAELSRRSTETGPRIGRDVISRWLSGQTQRPAFETVRRVAAILEADEMYLLAAAGYAPDGVAWRKWADPAQGRPVGPAVQPDPRPVGYGLDNEADGLTEDDIEDVRALIRAKRARRGLA
jgi:hypothetical protein